MVVWALPWPGQCQSAADGSAPKLMMNLDRSFSVVNANRPLLDKLISSYGFYIFLFSLQYTAIQKLNMTM